MPSTRDDLFDRASSQSEQGATVVPFLVQNVGPDCEAKLEFYLEHFDALKLVKSRAAGETAADFDLMQFSIGNFMPMQLTYPAAFSLLLENLVWVQSFPVVLRAQVIRMHVRNRALGVRDFACLWDALYIVNRPQPASRPIAQPAWATPQPMAAAPAAPPRAIVSGLPVCRCKLSGCTDHVEHAAVHYCRSCATKGCNIERHLP